MMVSNKNALDIVKNKINMKKLRYYAFAFFMVLGVSFFSACSEDEKEKEKFISTILTDSEGTLVLNIGETKSLFVTIPKDKTDKRIVWESSDEKVATIENGVVTYSGDVEKYHNNHCECPSHHNNEEKDNGGEK